MSLNYDLSKIKNSDSVCFEKTATGCKMRQETNNLIFATMFAQLGSIRPDNYMEFFKRLQLFAEATGHPSEITLEQVKAHIGLHCNVSDDSFAVFARNLNRIIKELQAKAMKDDKAKSLTK